MSNENLVIDTSVLLSELKNANQEMGQVIESITQISQHTNFLSLNSGNKIYGYAHTRGYNAYQGKNRSAPVSETL